MRYSSYGFMNRYSLFTPRGKNDYSKKMARQVDSSKIQNLKNKAAKFACSGKWKKALEQYLLIQKADPKNDRIMHRVAEIYLKVGETDKAKEGFKRLASLYAKNGFWAKAVSANKMVLSIDPGDLEVEKQIVEMYANLGIHTGPVSAPEIVNETTIDADDGNNQVASAEVGDTLELDSDRRQHVSDPDEQFVQNYMGINLDEIVEDEQSDASSQTAKPAESVVVAVDDAVDRSDPMDIPGTIVPQIEVSSVEEHIVELDNEMIELEDDVQVESETIRIPLFSSFGPEEFGQIIHNLCVRRIREGDLVCEAGDRGDSIYIIAMGTAEVLVPQPSGEVQKIAELKTGEFFGEFGMLSDGKRHATVKAVSRMELLEVTRQDLRRIANTHPQVIQVLNQYYSRRIVDQVLQQSELFSNLAADQRQMLVEKFIYEKIAKDTYLFKEGDVEADLFFIKSGNFEVSITRDSDVVIINHLMSGEFFGEIALLTHSKRTATIRAVEDGEVLRLSQAMAMEVINANPLIKGKLETLVNKRAEDAAAAYQSHQQLKMGSAFV